MRLKDLEGTLREINRAISAIRLLINEFLATEGIENGVESEELLNSHITRYIRLWRMVNRREQEIAGLLNTILEQELVGKLTDLGSKMRETYEDINRKWVKKPDLPKQGTADATRVTLSSYMTWAGDFKEFVDHCEYWEGVKWRMLELAYTAETLVGDTDYWARWMTEAGIRCQVDIMNLRVLGKGLSRGSYDNINEEERAWLGNVHTLITDIKHTAEALVKKKEGEQDTTELKDKIPKLRGLVEAHKHTPLVKGQYSDSLTPGAGGGGGGAAAEVERREKTAAEVRQSSPAPKEGVGESDTHEAEAGLVKRKGASAENSAAKRIVHEPGDRKGWFARLFRVRKPREKKAGQSDKKTKPNVPKSGSKP